MLFGWPLSILSWDESTYMPLQGASSRGEHIATLQRLAHEKFTSKHIGKLLDKLASLEPTLDPNSDEACLIRITQRDYERATKVPSEIFGRGCCTFFSNLSSVVRGTPE